MDRRDGSDANAAFRRLGLPSGALGPGGEPMSGTIVDVNDGHSATSTA